MAANQDDHTHQCPEEVHEQVFTRDKSDNSPYQQEPPVKEDPMGSHMAPVISADMVCITPIYMVLHSCFLIYL